MIFHFVVSIVLSLFASTTWADESVSKKATREPVKLPGLVIDFERQCVDLEATVCLDEGFLELVACTRGSKEHESIVAVAASPLHIHTALLLLGANNGNPAMRKQVGEEATRWVDVLPSGDPIDVYFVVKNSDGNKLQRPVSDFITRSQGAPDESDVDDHRQANEADKDNKFPQTFLFAGSHLHDSGKGPRQYLADLSGHVISIATFGDALLCLPGVQSHANGALAWRVNPKHLPKVGTNITLRLRPKKDQGTGFKQ